MVAASLREPTIRIGHPTCRLSGHCLSRQVPRNQQRPNPFQIHPPRLRIQDPSPQRQAQSRILYPFKPPASNSSLQQRRHISTYGYTQSKALVYSTYGEPKTALKLHTYSLSPPTSTKVTLRMLAAPVNPADVNQIQGSYPTKPELTSTLGTSGPSAVGGNEGVAEVIATGANVKTLDHGDWVVMRRSNMGTWRTHLQADEGEVMKIDKADREGLSPLQIGTASVNPITAYRMLIDFAQWEFRGGIGEGEWFVQNGANSAVGRAAIQLARAWGLKSLNVVRERQGWEQVKTELENLGATRVITDTELTSSREFHEKHLPCWTNDGREPIRLALNCVGGKPATALAKLLDPDCHMVTYGAMSRQPTQLPASLLIFQNVTMSGFWLTRWGNKHPGLKRQTLNDIVQMMRRGSLTAGPFEEIKWHDDTKIDELAQLVQTTLQGGRKGKAVFVFD